MKRFIRFTLLTAIISLVFACSTKSTEVKIPFTKGVNTQVVYKISQHTIINDTLNYNIDYIALYNIKPLDKYNAEVIIDSLYYSSSDGKVKLSYDSDSSDNKHFLKVFLAELKGKKFSLKLDEKLNVEEAKGLDEIISRTADKLHNMPGNLDLKDVIIKQFNDNAVTEEFRRIFDTIPAGKIQPGMKWKHTGRKRTGLSIDSQEEYTTGKVNDVMGEIILEGKLASSADADKGLITLKGSSEGTISYQMENPNYWSGILNQKLEGKGLYPQSKKEYSIIITSEISYTLGSLK